MNASRRALPRFIAISLCLIQIGLIPAFTGTVVDTVGAGDAFLAVTSPLVATGAPMQDVGFIGNAAGAMKVGIIGHSRSVEKVPLMKFVTSLLR